MPTIVPKHQPKAKETLAMQIDKLLGDLKGDLGFTFEELGRRLKHLGELKARLNAELDKELDSSQSLLADQQKTLEKLATLSDITSGAQDYEKLELDNNRLTAELVDLRTRFEQQQESLKLRFDELAKLTKLLMEQDARIADLQTAAKEAHRARKELKEAYQENQRELKIAWKKRKLAETERDELKQQLARAQTSQTQAPELQGLQQSLKDVQAHSKKLKAELAESQRELKVAWKKRKRLETLLAEHGLQDSEAPDAPRALPQAAETPDTATQMEPAEATPVELPGPEIGFAAGSVLLEYRGVAEQVADIRSSGCFDEDWYLSHYPDVARAGLDPVEHYVKYGWLEGRKPSKVFDTEDYVSRYPEVLESGLNPLVHWLRSEAVSG